MATPYPESSELLRAVAKALGAEDQPTRTFSLLVERGAIGATEFRKFRKWWDGQNRPLLPSAVAMLRAAGMLTIDHPRSTILDQLEAVATRLEEDAETVPEEELENAEVRLRAMAAMTLRGAEALAERRRAQGGKS